MNSSTQTAEEALHNGMQSVQQSAEQLRKKATQANDMAVGYIRQEPIKSVLIAAATGAALMALVGLISRGNNRHHG